MRHLVSLSILLALCACGNPGTSIVAPPVDMPDMASTKLVERPCARPIGDGKFHDDIHNTDCHFEKLNGVDVCLPDNMPRIIGGVCDPAGGPDRIWIDRNPDCNKGVSLYAIQRESRVCGNLTGLLQKVRVTIAADQKIYIFDPMTKSCTPSGFSARPDSPIVDRSPPPDPIFISEKDLPVAECK